MKPLGIKAYGSIGHLPNSRKGPTDRSIPEEQAKICTIKTRDKHDLIICQEKLDGSNVCVALKNGVLYPLGRAGYPAVSSPYLQHRLFHNWVMENEDRFRAVLCEGERIVGEWLAQAHGTIYNLEGWEPFFAFDIMEVHNRLTYSNFREKVKKVFQTPHLLHFGEPIAVEKALTLHKSMKVPCDEIEGIVYRVERKNKVDFLAKFVCSDKIDGKYLPEISQEKPIWNWKHL